MHKLALDQSANKTPYGVLFADWLTWESRSSYAYIIYAHKIDHVTHLSFGFVLLPLQLLLVWMTVRGDGGEEMVTVRQGRPSDMDDRPTWLTVRHGRRQHM
jgi:hypothetical protein